MSHEYALLKWNEIYVCADDLYEQANAFGVKNVTHSRRALILPVVWDAYSTRLSSIAEWLKSVGWSLSDLNIKIHSSSTGQVLFISESQLVFSMFFRVTER